MTKKKKSLKELKESIFGVRSFMVTETKDLQVEVKSWQNKTRIDFSINCPYTMNFMIDLNKDDTNKFIQLLKKTIQEL